MFGFPKPRPKIFDKRDQQRERERITREVYALVAERDRRQCRCCGRKGSYEASGSDKALHRHHLVYRSRGGVETSENLISLCRWCHALIHAKQLWPLGTNADRRITFEIHEAAVVDLFGNKPLPPHVRIITESRRRA